MKYLLDSNTCIRFLNQRSPEVIDHLTDTPDEDICLTGRTRAALQGS
jgi:predicted nucleic acid-binding protein